MLDINYIRENQKQVTDSIKRRGAKADLNKLLKLDEERRACSTEVDERRHKLNDLSSPSSSSASPSPSAEDIESAKKLKKELSEPEERLKKINNEYNVELGKIPNIIAEGTPDGGEENNRVDKETGKPKLDFKPKDHQALAEANGWLDFERGAKVAGSKFYYLKGAAVKLELAIMKYGMDLLEKEGFIPVIPPHMVSGRIAEGTGFAPRGEGEEEQEYKVQGEDLTLIGTAEVPLTGYHADEILEGLPLQYAGLSPSYRKEAGAYGKHSKGLYRVHQFDKLEMYVLCEPKDSDEWLQKILKLEERICEELEIPYRITRIAAGDLSAPAYEKYDVEYWSPVDENYRELTSCSNCTDYQARNLGIRYRNRDGKTEYVHTLNGTAIAFSRVFIALLENHQQPDGSVALPKTLHAYYGGGGL